LALGGIDFDAEVKAEGEKEEQGEKPEKETTAALVGASSPPIERSGRPAQFEPLRQTRYEIEDVEAQHREALGGDSILLRGAEATKLALWAAAPRARFLHLATHGWFASESFKSQLDTLSEQSARDSWQRRWPRRRWAA
jgi:CHAT domain-containing protein